jgi:hypothetical protein
VQCWTASLTSSPDNGAAIKKRRSIDHAFTSNPSDSDRGGFSALGREYGHTNGGIDQIDFECGRGYRGCCVASECIRAAYFYPKLPDWA